MPSQLLLNNSNLSETNAETTESFAENIIDNNSQHQDNKPSCLFCNKKLKKKGSYLAKHQDACTVNPKNKN